MEAGKTLDQGLDILDIEDTEESIFSKHIYSSIPYIYVGENVFVFNLAAAKHISCKRLLISKTTEYIIFRPTNSPAGYAVSNRHGNVTIAARYVIKATGLTPGTYYKLYQIKPDGYAIKRYEPIDWSAEIEGER